MRAVVAIPLAVAVLLFVRGAWRLRRCARPGLGAGRLVAAAAGFTALGVALSNDMHAAGHALFVAHMTQHLLLVSVAAPLLLLADPFPVVLWGLPTVARRAVGRALRQGRWLRRVAAVPMRMTITWPLYVLVLWLWHLPGPYDAALRSSLLHDLEHVVFFGAALLFWWPALGAAPRVARAPHPAARVAYLVLGALQNGALGLVLASRTAPLYATYAAGAATWGLSPVDDQVWGGVLMWTVGSAVDMAAVLLIVARALESSAHRVPTAVDVEPRASIAARCTRSFRVSCTSRSASPMPSPSSRKGSD